MLLPGPLGTQVLRQHSCSPLHGSVLRQHSCSPLVGSEHLCRCLSNAAAASRDLWAENHFLLCACCVSALRAGQSRRLTLSAESEERTEHEACDTAAAARQDWRCAQIPVHSIYALQGAPSCSQATADG